jgi:hypothetical protein
LVLAALDKLEEPASLVQLREAVNARLPRVDLPDILLEIAARRDFASKFTHVSERASRVGDFAVSVCAVLIAEACNIGLEPLVRADVPALRRARLSWVNQNFIRNERLTEANACLVAAQNHIPLVQACGGGEVASADGFRFVVPVRTLHAGPNPKYFGYKRGVTYYNLVSDHGSSARRQHNPPRARVRALPDYRLARSRQKYPHPANAHAGARPLPDRERACRLGVRPGIL